MDILVILPFLLCFMKMNRIQFMHCLFFHSTTALELSMLIYTTCIHVIKLVNDLVLHTTINFTRLAIASENASTD